MANFGNETVTIDAAQEFEGIPDTAKVYSTSINYQPDTITVGYALI